MKIIHSKYWLLLPVSILLGVVASFMVGIAGMFGWVLVMGLPFLGIGFVLSKLHKSQISFLKLAILGIFQIGVSFVAAIVGLLFLIFNAYILTISVCSGIFMIGVKRLINEKYQLPTDNLEKIVTFLSGAAAGLITASIFGMPITEQFIAINIGATYFVSWGLMLGYILYLLIFNLAIILPLAQKNRKVINVAYLFLLIALVVDILVNQRLLGITDLF